MEELCQEESPSGVFQVRQIPLDFASSFEFERSSHMVSRYGFDIVAPGCNALCSLEGTVVCGPLPKT